jgi:hypothetical protein
MNGRARAGVWRAMLAAERERRRRLALSPSAEDAAAELIDTLDQMAVRLLSSARPDDAAMVAQLATLVRAQDDAGIEALRAKYDPAPAEIVAWMIMAGDGESALDALVRYAAPVAGSV